LLFPLTKITSNVEERKIRFILGWVDVKSDGPSTGRHFFGNRDLEIRLEAV
jgi:hypothetical protein